MTSSVTHLSAEDALLVLFVSLMPSSINRPCRPISLRRWGLILDCWCGVWCFGLCVLIERVEGWWNRAIDETPLALFDLYQTDQYDWLDMKQDLKCTWNWWSWLVVVMIGFDSEALTQTLSYSGSQAGMGSIPKAWDLCIRSAPCYTVLPEASTTTCSWLRLSNCHSLVFPNANGVIVWSCNSSIV